MERDEHGQSLVQETEAAGLLAPETCVEEEARLQHQHLRDDVLVKKGAPVEVGLLRRGQRRSTRTQFLNSPRF